MKKKMIGVFLFCLVLVLSLRIPAFAEDGSAADPILEDSAADMCAETSIVEDNGLGESSAGFLEESTVEVSDEKFNEQNFCDFPENESPDSEKEIDVLEENIPEEAAKETASDEYMEKGAADEAVILPVQEETAENVYPYVVTLSDGQNSVDLTGGTSNRIADVLAGLGYDVADAVITVDLASVDTSVISVTETENGLVLDDNGPFSKADRKLVVYVNGVPVELTIVDPIGIGNKDDPDIPKPYPSSMISNIFEQEDGNIRLVGNAVVVDYTEITITKSGSHDLYLNGYTLDVKNSYFKINSDVVLNIYGGFDSTSEDKNGSITGIASSCLVINGGAVNVFGGNIQAATAQTAAISVLTDGNLNVYGGTIGSPDIEGTSVHSKGSCSVQMFGGTVKGENAFAVDGSEPSGENTLIRIFGGMVDGKLPAASSGQIEVAGGSFSTDPTPYLFCGNSDNKWLISAEDNVFTVQPSGNGNDYACVIVSGNNNAMTGTHTLVKALADSINNDVIILLKDLNEDGILDGKTVTLDLNGKILKGNCEEYYLGIVITVSGDNGGLILKDSAPTAIHSDALLPAGGIVTSEPKSGPEERRSYGAVLVGNGCNFTMNGGTIYGNTSDCFGGGVSINENGTFTMNGGAISCNNANLYAGYGGGVYVWTGGRFTMNGGTVSGNTGYSYGGGVFVAKDGNFTMNGGTISGNNAKKDGGGVYVGENGTFTMSDGTISGNNTQRNGGGVYAGENSSFTMNGGMIKANSGYGGGVYCISGMNISGSASITGNTGPDQNTPSNLCIVKGNLVSVGFNFFGSIGVTINISDESYQPGLGPFTTGNAVPMGVYFTSDDESLFIVSTADNAVTIGNNFAAVVVVRTQAHRFDTVQNAVNSGGAGTPKQHAKASVIISRDVAESIMIGKNQEVVLDLNGKILSRPTAESDRRVIYVYGKLTITDSEPSEIHSDTSLPAGGNITGGGIYNEGTIEMTGGSVSRSLAVNGGGVYNRGTFLMTGGLIIENSVYTDLDTDASSDTRGGGVYNEGYFELTGGSITRNKGTFSAAVYNSGTFKMTGGSISDNISMCDTWWYYGYVTAVDNEMIGKFIMHGGAITRNGGIFDQVIFFPVVFWAGTFEVGGTAVIDDNCPDWLNCNLVIFDRVTIATGDEAPRREMRIAVNIVEIEWWLEDYGMGCHVQDVSGFITPDFSDTMDYADNFIASSPNFCVVKQVPQKNLRIAPKTKAPVDFATSTGSSDYVRVGAERLVTMESLSKAQKDAISNLLRNTGSVLVAAVDTSTLNNGSSAFNVIEIAKSAFQGYEVGQLTVWILNEDYTLTEVAFEVINGNIVIRGCNSGIFILTASSN